MADQLPLVNYSGVVKQLQSGDSIAGANVDLFTSSLNGVVPASGGGTTNFLRADATWAAPAGGGSGVATDTIWQNKGDTVAATGLHAAAITPIAADGANYQALSANTNGVGWALIAQNSLLPTSSFTMFANNCVVLAGTLTLGAGITITMNAGSLLKMVS